jgi:putative ABC transport system substrate-binding protein
MPTWFLHLTLALVTLVAAFPAAADEPGKLYRVGFIGNSTAALESNLVQPFREGLRALGYVEGRDLTIEYRWAEGDYGRLPALVADLIARKMDVLVTAGTPAALAVKRATTTIPLVMVAVGDPVGTGLVASLARPELIVNVKTARIFGLTIPQSVLLRADRPIE